MKSNLIKLVAMCLGILFCVTACNLNTWISYTFNVETGDSIKIKLDTSDGHSMNSSVPIEIKKDDKMLARGIFVTLDTYDAYMEVVENNSKNLVLDSGKENNVTYTLYCHDDKEYNYLIKIDGSETGFILSSQISQDVVEECFDRLILSKE